jgi:lipopolysaccharide/colanic/teichoic acid biosynthesis glycosyltransferase
MYKYVKRGIDLIMAVLLLIIFLIPMLSIAVLIKLDSKGPVLFKQKRTGLKGKVFNLYKFRSMVTDNDVHDFSKGDQHTKVGNILRKTSLDELPQIINILKGEMSFIGPRPWITDYYDNMNEKQRHRNDVLPGITGLAQAKGRNNISINEKINYDLEYVKNYSFRQDVKIVFLTIKTVLSKEGADAGKNTIQNELEDLKTQNLSLDDIREAQGHI